MAELRLVRSGRNYFGIFRGVVVYIDGKRATVVRIGKGKQVELPAGRHQVWARIDYVRSDALSVSISTEDITTVHISASFWRSLLATVTLGKVRAIELTQTTELSRPAH
jgi:hypothetical protein